MRTIFVKQDKIERKWWLIDASNLILGKVAARTATLLRGKHKPEFAPHQEIGDYVVIINSAAATVSGNKRQDKYYYRHSGYPGGLKSENYAKLVERKPTAPMEKAIKGMLPKNKLGRKLFNNVYIYADDNHKQQAQKPQPITV